MPKKKRAKKSDLLGEVRRGIDGWSYRWTAPVLQHDRSDKELEQAAVEAQIKMGYHPAGYGFYRFQVKDGVASWSCGTSCD